MAFAFSGLRFGSQKDGSNENEVTLRLTQVTAGSRETFLQYTHNLF